MGITLEQAICGFKPGTHSICLGWKTFPASTTFASTQICVGWIGDLYSPALFVLTKRLYRNGSHHAK